jgi:polysaccharide export outer membrane protein
MSTNPQQYRGTRLVISADLLLVLAMAVLVCRGQSTPAGHSVEGNHGSAELGRASRSGRAVPEDYLLGPGDEIVIWARDAEEITQGPIKIENDGAISVPLAGRLPAAGLTIHQLEAAIVNRLKTQIIQPQVTINITNSRSQPVSVLGAVNKSGVVQLQGQKSLVEMLSLAGGVRPDAGYTVKITRRIDRWGRLPLGSAKDDSTGQFSIATVNLKAIMEAHNPEENIQIRPDDVISVPRAEMVYVVGEVKKAGGIVLKEHESISVLQALSLAEGLERTASAKNSKILRSRPGGTERLQIAVNLPRILSGKGEDIRLNANDILFVPNNAAKSVMARTLESAIEMGTNRILWRR